MNFIEDIIKQIFIFCHQKIIFFFTTKIKTQFFIFSREYEKGTCAPLAGTGKEENRNNFYPHSAAFAQPSGVCWVGSPFHSVFVADSESSSIRRIHIQRGRVTAVVGGDRSPFVISNLFILSYFIIKQESYFKIL